MPDEEQAGRLIVVEVEADERSGVRHLQWVPIYLLVVPVHHTDSAAAESTPRAARMNRIGFVVHCMGGRRRLYSVLMTIKLMTFSVGSGLPAMTPNHGTVPGGFRP